MPTADRPLWFKSLRAVGRFVVTAVLIAWTILDALLFPLFRPLIAKLGELRIFEAIGAGLGRLPPYVALIALAVPFIIIEPVKIFALYWFGVGHFIQGAVLLVIAHVGSILIVERVYHAMHRPLMQIGWFERLMSWLDGLRRVALDWARTTSAWQAASRLVAEMKATVASWFRSIRQG